MIKKVKDLIEALQQFDPSAEVVVTWECQTTELEVYKAADGRVMIDSDGGYYKVRWQELKCEVCGCAAVNAPFKGKPICYEHWNTFNPLTKVVAT